MTAPNPHLDPNPIGENQEENLPEEIKGNSMDEYYQLKQRLFLATLATTLIIFISVWIIYSLNIGLNYLLGACVGLVYLRRLAKDVEGLGGEKISLGSGRLVFFVGIIVLSTQLRQLQILPIFLGFITYKAAIIIYVLQTTLFPAQK